MSPTLARKLPALHSRNRESNGARMRIAFVDHDNPEA